MPGQPTIRILIPDSEHSVDPHRGYQCYQSLESFTRCRHLELPYPPSEVIRFVKFAPASEIRRQAQGIQKGSRFDGSDNWPITWADDGHQYTAYGDGYGFEPYTELKLGMGFARIEGGRRISKVLISGQNRVRIQDLAQMVKRPVGCLWWMV